MIKKEIYEGSPMCKRLFYWITIKIKTLLCGLKRSLCICSIHRKFVNNGIWWI